MKTLQRLIYLLGMSEDEAIAAIAKSVCPPQIGAIRKSMASQEKHGFSAPDADTIRSVLRECDYRCECCGSQSELRIKHMTDDQSDHSQCNLKIMCLRCCIRGERRDIDSSCQVGRLASAIVRLYDEIGRFPANRQILEESEVKQIGGYTDFVEFMKWRFAQEITEPEPRI